MSQNKNETNRFFEKFIDKNVMSDQKNSAHAQKLATSKKIRNFLSNQADIQATLLTHELIILTKFHNV